MKLSDNMYQIKVLLSSNAVSVSYDCIFEDSFVFLFFLDQITTYNNRSEFMHFSWAHFLICGSLHIGNVVRSIQILKVKVAISQYHVKNTL